MLIAQVLGLVLAAIPAGARAGTVTLERVDPSFGDVSQGMWTWAANGTAYQLVNRTSTGFRHLMSIDAETGVPLAFMALPFPVHHGFDTPSESAGMHVGVLDEDAGVLHLAYEAPQTVQPPTAGTAVTERCARVFPVQGCLGGFMEIDARTLALRRVLPLPRVTSDGPLGAPLLRSLELVDDPKGGQARLLAIFEERQVAGLSSETDPRGLGANAVGALQLDPVTGLVDWLIRLPDCRGTREGRGAFEAGMSRSLAHPATGFVIPDRTTLVIGCHAAPTVSPTPPPPLDPQRPDLNWQAQWAMTGALADRQGLIVRIPLGPDGAPTRVAPGVAIGGTSTAGPGDVREILADPASATVVFRSGAEFGPTTFHVVNAVDGRAKGSLDVGLSEIGEGAAGIDRARGRLYVISPARNFAGLLLVDLRRRDVGPGRTFGEFETLADSRLHPIASLTDGRDTLVFVRSSQRGPTVVLRDSVRGNA